MHFLRSVRNPHTGYKYRLFFDSREFMWLIQGETPDGQERVILAWFTNPRKAKAHLKHLAYKRRVTYGIKTNSFAGII